MNQEIITVGDCANTGDQDSFLLPNGSVDKNRLMLHNKSVIFDALKHYAVVTAEVTYSGYGDEGSISDITLTPLSARAREHQVIVKVGLSCFDNESRQWSYSVSIKKIPLDEAIEQYADALIEFHGHSGYENSDGGNGCITFSVVSSLVQHDHYDNVVEQIETCDEL